MKECTKQAERPSSWVRRRLAGIFVARFARMPARRRRTQEGRCPTYAEVSYHYFFKALDVDAAERVLGSWACGSDSPGHVALDGKRLRGSAPAGHDGREEVHPVSAFAGRLGAVIGRLRVSPEDNEATAALALLKRLPLKGAVVTGDAAFCQRAICEAVLDGGGEYLFAVKANQPRLMSDIAVSFGDAFPPCAEGGAG